ncbi:uncharacterized protein LOC126381947 isoform X3 [Pectinophora gossypiella]|nr:uncharacterized protein LOC126381947 isoform X3 [Pectinophora gossypiella]
MSWPQRGGAAPAHPQHPQRPPQGYNNQQNMYPNYQGAAAPPTGNTQQQYWQSQQPAQYTQQYGQVYQQQDYGNNANQFYQQPPQQQYNQNYANQGYTNPQQQYPQNYYQNQGVQQQNYQGQPNTDSWEDNWDWGWDESTKQAQQNSAAHQAPATQPVPPAQNQQVYNNANVIEESFASTDTWNWSMEDKKESKQPVSTKQGVATLQPENTPENNAVSEPPPPRSGSNLSTHAPTEEVKTLGDREVVKERLPNLALGKRFNLDNLTPQWSIESQMSQESSDGPQTHSEGTYRSDNPSRNSSKSSPGLNTENSNFNYSQSALDEYPPSNEWSRHSNEEPTLVDSVHSGSRRESHDDLASSLHEMSITNRENPAPEHHPVNKESINAPPASVSPAHPPPQGSPFMPPPPAGQSLAPSVAPAAVPPPPSSGIIPPPTSFPQTSSATNPFKQSGPFSHKKGPSASSSMPTFPPPTSNTNLSSPNVVNKLGQHRMPIAFGANLETTPDNSERPDQPQMSALRLVPVAQQMPENLEVAPQNDRNEYLQTAHLSSGDYGENTDFSRTAPPPGLRRMVVGQQESEYNQNLNMSGDEPPPGLARMVPGQQTEADNSYNQPSDNFMDRHVDGQPTDGGGRVYLQADGQPTPDSYPQPSARPERRPRGLARLVPGEPSDADYPQYPPEQRVVTGLDRDYPLPDDAGPADVREQNMDGSDYSEQTPRSAQRNVIGNDPSQSFNPLSGEQQREVTMEGENLQDLSAISADITYSREPAVDGADVTVTDMGADRKTDHSDSMEHAATSSRRQSLNRVNTSGEESDRDRAFKASPRRDKHKSSRDRDRDRDAEGRYSRGDRKYDRERDGERKPTRDKDKAERERRDRDDSPHSRRHRRSTRSRRYETEDTDYYSDRERERRSYREGSYASKPPRPEDKDRRYERERSRRYNTIERDRRPDDERCRPRDERHRSERHREPRYEPRYRDIDPTRKHGNLRAEREDDERRRVTFSSQAKDSSSKEGEVYSSASRPGSREAPATDEEPLDAADARRRERRRHARHERSDRSERADRSERPDRQDPYYDMSGYGGGAYAAGGYGSLQLQRATYEYYERLRVSDPHAYLVVYKQLMAGRAPPPPPHLLHLQHLQLQHEPRAKHAYPVYGVGYEGREDRGSVHSGRSSTNGLKGNDTYFMGGAGLRYDAGSLRGNASLLTDASDRELNTDASLNLQLEESTVRSERMTPFKFSTAHIKGSIGSRHVVVVRPSYPVDGLPATVQILSMAAACARDPMAQDLAAYPGPLVKGVTHKKSVMEYCALRVRGAARAAPRDVAGYALLWDLLALLLRQNGVVVGTDIAELLMKNTKEYEYKPLSAKNSSHNESRRGSSLSGREDERAWSPEQPSVSTSDLTPQEESSSPSQAPVDEKVALDRLREYLTYGNRQEALEWAMKCGLWGHAMALAGSMERRARAGVAARFLRALPHTDPLHTLYAQLQARAPPAATCVTDERWADWRPHAAIMLSNSSAKPDQDRRTLVQLGDSLLSRGQLYSAQFCYVSAGTQLERHPLAPLAPPAADGAAPAAPRLALLLADSRATSLAQLATNHAIFATEIYEYALSLNQDFVINELQVYKLVLATRLVDVGQYERALGYVEAAARAVTRAPRAFPPALVARLADLADRLKYHDPALAEDPPLVDEPPDSAEPSPRHQQQWLDDVKNIAHMLTAEASQHTTPQHTTPQHNYYDNSGNNTNIGWDEQAQQQYQPQTYAEPEESPDYSQYYQQQQQSQLQQQQELQQQQLLQQQQQQQQLQQSAAAPAPAPPADEWPRADEAAPPYDTYWQGDSLYSYGEGGGEAPRPMITMPGSGGPPRAHSDYGDDPDNSADQQDRDTQTPKAGQSKKQEKKEDGKPGGGGSGGGWLGGILTKLSLRPPNQMILPDDKNPTIVWDAEQKRWRNLDGDEDAAAPPPPPPARGDLPQLQNMMNAMGGAPPAAGAPPSAPVSNIFKMQKGRHIKKSYVDVFNPPGASPAAPPPPPELLAPPPAPAAAPANYFVPAPVHHEQSGIYDPMQESEIDAIRRQSGI